MMSAATKAYIPSFEQEVLFKAIDRELADISDLTPTARAMFITRCMDDMDFSNETLWHKSARGWARLILNKIKNPNPTTPKIKAI